MINVAPGATFEAVTEAFSNTATVGVRIRDNAGADFLARTVSGVTQDLAVGTSAIYRRSFTAPAVNGQWTIVWDDGTLIDIEELVVSAAAAAGTTGSLYATRAELLSTLDASGTTYLDDDLDDALNAACRAIDQAAGRRFFPSDETRTYTAEIPCGSWGLYRTRRQPTLEIDDLNTLETLKVDTDGDGVYETTWVEGTDFYLDPPNAPLLNLPYERVVIPYQSGRVFPLWDNAIQIVGSFGFALTPPEVKQYAKILAAQLLIRSRQAPFGIIQAGTEIGSTTRLSRFDPDFNRLLGDLIKPHQLVA
jgi:hypothetical protein